MNESFGTLLLLHTNDIHSRLENVARIAGFVGAKRETVPLDRLLLIDCGDFLDRFRPETEGSGGLANRRLLDALAYDAVTLGNNEGLSYTKAQLDELFEDAAFPVVCANLTDWNTGRRPRWMKPFAIVKRAGLRIGLLGLTAAYEEFYRLLGWRAEDPIHSARNWVARLREEEKADLVVVISHLGIRLDEQMAETIEGIDLVLGAHTHHLLETPLRIGGSMLCAAGKFGRHVGVVEIAKNPETGELVIDGRCVPTAELEPDPKIEALLERERAAAAARMDVEIANLREPLEAAEDRDSPLATLLASEVRRATGAEIGLINAGQLLGGLPAGRVTRADLHAICPSPINPCLMKLRGSRIRSALEESLLPEFIGLAFHGYGFRGRALGTLCADGLEWTVDESRPRGERVVAALAGGVPLDDEREYAVGTLDMFTFGVGYLDLKEGTVERYFLPEFIRDLLADALNDEAALADCRRPRRRSVRERL